MLGVARFCRYPCLISRAAPHVARMTRPYNGRFNQVRAPLASISSVPNSIFVNSLFTRAGKVTPKRLKKHLKDLVQQYGAVVMVFHTCVWGASWAGFYFLIELESDYIDARFLFDYFEAYLPKSVIENKESVLDATHSFVGKLGISYTLAMATGPARFALTLVVAPWLARRIGSISNPFFQKFVLQHPSVQKIFKPPGQKTDL